MIDQAALQFYRNFGPAQRNSNQDIHLSHLLKPTPLNRANIIPSKQAGKSKRSWEFHRKEKYKEAKFVKANNTGREVLVQWHHLNNGRKQHKNSLPNVLYIVRMDHILVPLYYHPKGYYKFLSILMTMTTHVASITQTLNVPTKVVHIHNH